MSASKKSDANFVTGREGLIVVDNGDNRVLFLDPKTYETTLVLDGFAPSVHELAIAPDRRRAFCAVYGDGYHGANPHPGHVIAVINLGERRHIADFSTAPYVAPHGLRWSPKGELFCNCEMSGVVLQLDADTGEHVATIEVGSDKAHRMEMLPDGSKLYTENEEDAFASVIDIASRKLVKRIATPNGLAGIGLSPDGKRILLVDDREPQLLLVDTGTDEITGSIRLDGHDKGAQIARYSPNGQFCVVTSYQTPLATIFNADLSVGRLVRIGNGPMNMAFDPDGRTVLIGNMTDGTISVVDMEQAEVLRTVKVGGGPETLSFF